MFYIEYFILIYSLFISLEIDNKFILFTDGSALVHLLLDSLLQLQTPHVKFALPMFKLLRKKWKFVVLHSNFKKFKAKRRRNEQSALQNRANQPLEQTEELENPSN